MRFNHDQLEDAYDEYLAAVQDEEHEGFWEDASRAFHSNPEESARDRE